MNSQALIAQLTKRIPGFSLEASVCGPGTQWYVTIEERRWIFARRKGHGYGLTFDEALSVALVEFHYWRDEKDGFDVAISITPTGDSGA